MTEVLQIRGRAVGAAQLEQIRAWLGLHPAWSRRRLSEALARDWDWRTPTGQLKDIAARDLLNRLEARGLIRLPARQRRGGVGGLTHEAPPSDNEAINEFGKKFSSRTSRHVCTLPAERPNHFAAARWAARW